MTHDEWVQAALAARVEQFGTVEITDPATLDYLADVFLNTGTATTESPSATSRARRGSDRGSAGR